MEYIVGAAAFVLAVGVLFFLFRGVARLVFGRSRRLERDLALGMLRDRLSRGEITRAQFDDGVVAVGKG